MTFQRICHLELELLKKTADLVHEMFTHDFAGIPGISRSLPEISESSENIQERRRGVILPNLAEK